MIWVESFALLFIILDHKYITYIYQRSSNVMLSTQPPEFCKKEWINWWINPYWFGGQVLCILEAKFTVSPKRQKRGAFIPMTP